MKLKRLRPDAVLPTRATPGSAGYDLCAAIDAPLTLRPGERILVPTGWAADPGSEDCVLMICARSGLALRNGIAMANGVGIVDSDYRGELRVPTINLSDVPYTLRPGERFAQLLVVPVRTPELEVVEELEETERGSGGFGHSGAFSPRLKGFENKTGAAQ